MALEEGDIVGPAIEISAMMVRVRHSDVFCQYMGTDGPTGGRPATHFGDYEPVLRRSSRC